MQKIDGDPVLATHLAAARRASRKWGVEVAVLLAMLKKEGGTDEYGRPVRPGDGLGPPSFGQFIYSTGKALGVVFGNSYSEVDAMARYLIQLGYKRDRTRAIGAYNGGPGNPQYGYARDVLALAEGYRARLSNLPAGFGLGALAGADAPGATTGGLFDEEERSGALKALLWVNFVLGAFALAGLGLARLLGLRPPAAGAPA